MFCPVLTQPMDVTIIFQTLFHSRLDSTLIDFADMKWQRGDISIIFNGEAEGSLSFT